MAVSKQFPFGTIVVAMDFSENSSLRYVQAIARWCGANLVLVHVIDPIGYAFPTGMPRSISTDQAAREELNQVEESLSTGRSTMISLAIGVRINRELL